MDDDFWTMKMVSGQIAKVLMLIIDSCLCDCLLIQSFWCHRNNLRIYKPYLLMLSLLISSVSGDILLQHQRRACLKLHSS